MLPNPFEKLDSRSGPSKLDPWLDRNSQESADYARETEGGMRIVAYGLLAITFVLFIAIFWGAHYL
jgi:hypothetical protein